MTPKDKEFIKNLPKAIENVMKALNLSAKDALITIAISLQLDKTR